MIHHKPRPGHRVAVLQLEGTPADPRYNPPPAEPAAIHWTCQVTPWIAAASALIGLAVLIGERKRK